MPLYFFNVDNGRELTRDAEGSVLPNLDAAGDEATMAAREIMSPGVLDGEAPNGRKFLITDEAGIILINRVKIA